MGAQALEGLRAAADRLRPRDTHDSFAGRLQQRLPLCVVLASEPIAVPCGAVGFDHQALVGPAEVRDHAPAGDGERAVDVRVLQPARQDEVQHRVLELAAGGRVTGCEDLRERGHAAARPEPVERAGELADRDERALRLTDRAAQARYSKVAARSTRVRAGVVAGMSLWRVTSSTSSIEERWTRMPRWARFAGAVTSG
jgi:hypothetical protein